MSVKQTLLLIVVMLFVVQAQARTIYMGAGQEYKTLEEVEEGIREGDILEIVPGIYRDCGYFDVNNIVIRPKGWPKHTDKVRFQDVSCGGKGIFVIDADNVRIDSIEFVNAKVPDLNGAGIRYDGNGLYVYDSYFYKNENGILTGDGNHQAEIIVSRSIFESNGSDGQSHGIYVNEASKLKVIDSKFLYTKIGHHIKSRAQYTEVIGSEIMDGEKGTASYAIDVSNGGSVLIENNIIQKGPLSDNRGTAICIACEGGFNPGETIIVRNNTFTNDTKKSGVVFLRNLTSVDEQIEGNTLKGDRVVELSDSFAN